MTDPRERAVAVVGLGAVLPDAPDAPSFWSNVAGKRYSITEVPEDRWSAADYWDPDPSAPDKTYSKIGSWVRGFQFDWKRYLIPPRVASVMDEGQQWAVAIAQQALDDYGFPSRPLDTERTGVILGAAMGGELHYLTSLRIHFPHLRNALSKVDSFQALPSAVKDEILARWHEVFGKAVPPVTEDTMPGELANIIAGRVANVLNLRGTNFTTDAACASSFAAVQAAMDVLVRGQCDAVVTGGVDRNMGVTSFVKFSKIGALSATGTRPFGDGADGFVMGEGSAAFLLKRLADAERDGDRVYAVLRGVGGSSDGKGKGITAPNPIGQRLAVARAWQDAGLDPATAGLVEAHGTSTKVGDVVEVESLAEVFGGAPRGAIGLGSAKSNIGHLKAGAGAAGLLKAVWALHHKLLPPTLNAEVPNPAVDFPSTPFFLSRELREWERRDGTPRRCGVSAYGFGGTNFHIVLEEHVPGMLTSDRKATVAVPAAAPVPASSPAAAAAPAPPSKMPLRPIAALGAATAPELRQKLEELLGRVRDGFVPPAGPPPEAVLASRERLLVDFDGPAELLDRLQKAEKAIGFDTPPAWKALAAQGIFRGSGRAPGKLAFLFPGQGSQYPNMARPLAELEEAPRAVFAEADAVTAPLLGKPVTGYIFVDGKDPDAVKAAEHALMQTAITQPAMLSADLAIAALLREYGFAPDVVMGHSLGEYAALVVSGILPFAHALEAASARGREMTNIRLEDNGCMAAVMAPLDVVDDFLSRIEGYVVKANINSVAQCVIGGETKAVEAAVKAFKKAGYAAVKIQVSHAFHTRIVAPASDPLGVVLDRLDVKVPRLPLVANVTGGLYPTTVPEIKETLKQQIANPVQWVKGLETLWAEGVRTFVEVGPKKALKGFTDDVLGHRPDLVSLATNHPKPSQPQTFNHALCGLWAAGYGAPAAAAVEVTTRPRAEEAPAPRAAAPAREAAA
ncbi:MAG: acyltransferase domain-containing protein, partial [Acidobacteria bacterium]